MGFISGLIASAIGLVLGTLYPAYASYKAVRTKNVREYVKWMMYWIVFAGFSTIETFADVFVAFWFPFYYEVKIVVLLWLISPVSRGSLGSSMLYRKLVHPHLLKHEKEIDSFIGRLKLQGYNTIANAFTQAFNFVTTKVMQTAIQHTRGLPQLLLPPNALNDEVDHNEGVINVQIDEVMDHQVEESGLQRNPAHDVNEEEEMIFEEVESVDLEQEIENEIESPVRTAALEQSESSAEELRSEIKRLKAQLELQNPQNQPSTSSIQYSYSAQEVSTVPSKRRTRKPKTKIDYSSDEMDACPINEVEKPVVEKTAPAKRRARTRSTKSTVNLTESDEPPNYEGDDRKNNGAKSKRGRRRTKNT